MKQKQETPILINSDTSTEGNTNLSKENLKQWGYESTPLLKAVRAKCVDCSGGSVYEANKCTDIQCPLWVFRLGKNPFKKTRKLSEEHKRKLQQGKKRYDEINNGE